MLLLSFIKIMIGVGVQMRELEFYWEPKYLPATVSSSQYKVISHSKYKPHL